MSLGKNPPAGEQQADSPWSMTRKSVKRFSLATNAKGVCAEVMLKQKSRVRWRFNL